MFNESDFLLSAHVWWIPTFLPSFKLIQELHLSVAGFDICHFKQYRLFYVLCLTSLGHQWHKCMYWLTPLCWRTHRLHVCSNRWLWWIAVNTAVEVKGHTSCLPSSVHSSFNSGHNKWCQAISNTHFSLVITDYLLLNELIKLMFSIATVYKSLYCSLYSTVSKP